MTETQIVGSLMIVGALVSVVLNVLKARYGSLRANKSKLVLVAISIAVGGVYHVLQATGVWPVAYMVLSTSSLVYAFFFKK